MRSINPGEIFIGDLSRCFVVGNKQDRTGDYRYKIMRNHNAWLTVQGYDSQLVRIFPYDTRIKWLEEHQVWVLE